MVLTQWDYSAARWICQWSALLKFPRILILVQLAMFASLSQSTGLNSSTMKKSIRVGTAKNHYSANETKWHFCVAFPKENALLSCEIDSNSRSVGKQWVPPPASRSSSYIFSSLEAVLSRRARQNFNLSNWLDRVTWQAGCKQQVQAFPAS